MITVYSISPALSGAGTIVDRNSDRNSRVFNGFETQFMARGRGATVFGGTSTSKQVSNNCDLPLTISSTFAAASNPNATIFCDQTQFDIPYQTQVKVGGTYDLPLKFVVSGTFQSYPGAINSGTGNTSAVWLPVTLTATRAVAPGLTQASESIPLIYPGSKYPRSDEPAGSAHRAEIPVWQVRERRAPGRPVQRAEQASSHGDVDDLRNGSQHADGHPAVADRLARGAVALLTTHNRTVSARLQADRHGPAEAGHYVRRRLFVSKKILLIAVCAALAALLVQPVGGQQAASVTSPKQHFGFEPGDDGTYASMGSGRRVLRKAR